jgi:hypothetical protein
MHLQWKTPAEDRSSTSLWSEVGDGVDYYFVYGPKLDDVIAGYRSSPARLHDAQLGVRPVAVAAAL